MTRTSTGYRSGSHWIISDRSGKKIRSEDSRREWNGSIVHKDEWEPRHPQDQVRAVADRQVVPNPRPRPTDQFKGALTTALSVAAVAGDTSITVDATTSMTAGDRVRVMLDNTDSHLTTIASVTDGTHLVLTAAMPGAAAIDKAVVDMSAVT